MAKQKALIAALQQLGDSRVEATLVASLLPGKPLTTASISTKTGLRQPEVSVGMASLTSRGWISRGVVPRKGRGRPMHEYTLSATKTALKQYYGDQSKQQVQAAKDAGAAVRAAL